MKFLRSSILMGALLAALLNLPVAQAANVVSGTIADFTGPDDLNLDPATNVIAVDVWGSSGALDVNGVTFDSDTAGTVTRDAVTVTTASTHMIDGWSGVPAYSGIDAVSTDNLELIMHDIRWSLNPANLTVDIAGLAPGTIYEVQMLFSENGSGGDRHWDIGVDGALVVDDFDSAGTTPSIARVYTGEFDPGADGTLNIVLGVDPLPADPNNTAPLGADNNPILQAVIVHSAAPPTAPDDITLEPSEFAAGVPIGTVVGALGSQDPNGGTHDYELVSGDGDTDNARFQIDGDQLETAIDFSALGGSAFSIRVRSTDETDLSFDKAITVTAAADSDSDTLEDSWELMFGELSDFNGLANGPGPGAGTGDFDGDGSSDSEEFANNTDPSDEDSDDDGSNDGDEATAGTNPNVEDSDNDGLTDGEEATEGTNPLEPDSDGDTILDGDEVDAGTDPNESDTDMDGAPDNIDPDPLDPDVFSPTVVLNGEIIEFMGPDDLNLDPAKNVIAVNSFGDGDLVINGVTFQGDGPDPGVGTVTNDGVTVTTTAANQIIDWTTPGRGGQVADFSGVDQTSADNLEIVMTSIRWMAAPDPVTVEIAGLTPGASYEVQLLTNEGANRARHWDISVEDELVVDNYTSEGSEIVGIWSPTNSFAYAGEFEGPGDGVLNVVMQQQLGGQDPRGADNNPIIQGIVVNLAQPAVPFAITEIDHDSSTGLSTITWNSIPGRFYAVDFSSDLAQGNWIELDDGVAADSEQTSFSDDIPRQNGRGFYRVRLP